MNYDLEERTLKFAKAVLNILKTMPISLINSNIINQLIRSVTSVGANYREANAGSSKKDFRNKIFICRKEIQETKYWIELLADISDECRRNQMRVLWKEAHELTLIFNKISSSLKD
ncbi:MAG: four helix bundle protein [Candidatus Magasanikbacteria bacterium]|jgi:four helix bundle protein